MIGRQLAEADTIGQFVEIDAHIVERLGQGLGKLDHRFDDYASHANGITVQAFRGKQLVDERGAALIGADGIWSAVGNRLKNHRKPAFAHRTAWRTLVPSDNVPDYLRAPAVHLFLGMDAHLVAYPVKAGALVNIVGIVNDNWSEAGWNAPGDRAEILRHFARFTWHESVRELIGIPQRWLKWALFDNATPFAGGAGAVTLIGDAAHPMLPFLAQGAGMAVEDAAVLADRLKEHSDNPAAGLLPVKPPPSLRFIGDKEQYPHDFVTTFAPLPVPADATDPWNGGGINNWIMAKEGTPNLDAAWTFIRFWLVDGAKYMLKAGKVPAFPGTDEDTVIEGILGPDRDTLYDVEAYRKVVFADDIRLVTDSITTAGAEIQTIVDGLSDRLFIGEISVDEWVTEAKTQADAAIAAAS